MKLGSVTVGGVFKGILVEVEYCPCVVPNNCWGILQEFMQVAGTIWIQYLALNVVKSLS